MTLDKATEAGSEYGHAAATWVEINSTDDARQLLSMYEDGDPAVYELEPAPLSGEWAGESIADLSERFGVDLSVDDFAEAFEVAYSQAFWLEVQRAALALVQS